MGPIIFSLLNTGYLATDAIRKGNEYFAWESLTLYVVKYWLSQKRGNIINKSRFTLIFQLVGNLYCNIWKLKYVA